MTHDELMLEIQTEFARLKLDRDRAPFDLVNAMSDDADDHDWSDDLFLARLRGLSPGATWRDVFVDLPAHWDLEDPETWSVPFHPLGPLDFSAPPVGPALVIAWPADIDDGCLDRLCSRISTATIRIHAAWFMPLTAPFPERLAYVVLPQETSNTTFAAVKSFIETDAEARLWGVARTGSERYLRQ